MSNASSPDGSVHVPARTIPAPTSISPEARLGLAQAAALPLGVYPPPSDKAAWKQYVARADAGFKPMFDRMRGAARAEVEKIGIAGVTVYVATPHAPRADRSKQVRLTLHGGALVMLGGEFVGGEAAMTATESGCLSYSVDYRMPPDHPYPAAVDDGVAVYRELCKRHEAGRIAISGGSAGGNLAAAVTLKARDLGLPLPAAAVLLTPELDLTESGDSFETNALIDVVLKGRLRECNELYANGHDLRDPYLSPLFGDFSKGFPPTFLQAGTRDLFLSNTVRMHRALLGAGVEAELHVFEGMPHGGFMVDCPEGRELQQAVERFLAKHWG